MRKRLSRAGILGVGAVLAVLGGGWYLLSLRQAKFCPFSGRVIHAQTRALVTIGGKKYETCCVRCAIVEAQQTGKPLRILKVADFYTGGLLEPNKAWFVESSTVNFCMRTEPGAESPGRESVYLRGFDRCSPSAFAFSDERSARAFIGQHGGVLKRLDDLLREATPTSPRVQKP
jgi:hypothetical protein